jgi:hypothetical protein
MGQAGFKEKVVIAGYISQEGKGQSARGNTRQIKQCMQARLYGSERTIKTTKIPSRIEPIREEPDYPLRHHRPRPPLQRNLSAPQLISTKTTAPVHINNRSAHFLPPLFLPHSSAAVCRPRSCPVANPSTPVFVAPVTSTSRLPPPALLQSPCAMKSPASSPP